MLWISVSIFLTVVAWMVLEIYKVRYLSNLTMDQDQMVANTQLSVDVIKILKTRQP